jgi:hypothetical protein
MITAYGQDRDPRYRTRKSMCVQIENYFRPRSSFQVGHVNSACAQRPHIIAGAVEKNP